MTKLMTAFALAVALPTVANAQTALAPAPKAQQGHKIDCKCCKDMAAMGHAGHDMGKPGAKAPHADRQQKPQQQ
ncbi:MAG: hypothetical protein M3438_08815 [Pseudomonadota bacterium]|nr:hypothetical protein [Sphingomonas sp.]MDQ3479243.1 hypothetical protein [Pseudomonadota bacterium]